MKDAVPARRRAADIRGRRRRQINRPRPERAVFLQVRKLEKRLDRLRDPNLESWQIAQEVLRILRLLVARETGNWDLCEAASLFSARLWAGPAVSDLVCDINQRCAAILYRLESLAVQDYESADAFARDLQTLLSWYLSRKTMLIAAERGAADSDEETIFGFEVVTDARRQDTSGLLVRFSARLIGRASQQLWARLQLRDERGPVRCRKGWESWSDSGSVEPPRAAMLQPLVPDSQKRVVDGIELFLPYAALDIGNGRSNVIIEAAIVDSDDIPVVSARRKELIYLRSGDEKASVSPQASCVWAGNPVSGDSLKNLAINVARDTSGSEWLVVTYDLMLFGHEGEALDIELRILDENGEIVGSTDEQLADWRGGLVMSETIFPRGAMAQHRGMAFEVPLRAVELEWPCGRLDCEVSVRDSSGRAICGAVSSMSGSDLARSLEANPFRRPMTAEAVSPSCAPLRARA